MAFAIDTVWRLRFDPVVEGAAVIELPCDEQGFVHLDALDDGQRRDYFGARALRDLYHPPRVVRADDH